MSLTIRLVLAVCPLSPLLSWLLCPPCSAIHADMDLGSSSLRDRDLVKWLENKLGAADELWNGRTAAGLLSREMIAELDSCFQVRAPVLLGCPYLT